MKSKRTFTRKAMLATLLSTTLGLTLCAMPASATTATSFHDVSQNNWAIRYITEMNAKGVIEGDGNGYFRPQASVTHEEAIVMTIRAMGLTKEAQSNNTASRLALTDSQNVSAWAKPYVAVALQHGLIDPNTTLLPQQAANREWVTELVVRALGLQSEAEAHMHDSLAFTDASSIDSAYVGYVAIATEQGILHGYPNQTFQPQQPVLRQEMATILCQADAQLDQASGSQTTSDPIPAPTPTPNPNPVPTPNPPTWAMQSDGMISAFTAPTSSMPGSITITPFVQSQMMSPDPSAEQAVTLSVAQNATVTENGVAQSFAAVQPGDRVRLEIVADTVQSITLVQAAYPRSPIQPQSIQPQ